MNPHNADPTVLERYREIVVPTDGSDGAEHAAEHALMVAGALDATVHVVSVQEDPGSIQRDQLRTSPEELASDAVESVAERARERGIDVRTDTLSGSPEQAILLYVEEQGADLVVMSTHGRTGIQQVVFGSVTEDVVRESPVPVLTVRPPEWKE